MISFCGVHLFREDCGSDSKVWCTSVRPESFSDYRSEKWIKEEEARLSAEARAGGEGRTQINARHQAGIL